MTDGPTGPTSVQVPPHPLPTVQQALARVIHDMPAIGKEGRNKEQGYNFRGIDDVLAALKPLAAKHGVLFVPDAIERVPEERVTQRGTVMHTFHLHVRWRIYGPAGDYIEASTWGEGTDAGDKATNKAATAAFKYLLFPLLVVADHGDADADLHTPEDTVRDQGDWWVANGWKDEEEGRASKARVMQRLRELDDDMKAAVKEQLAQENIDVSSILTRTEYDTIMSWLPESSGGGGGQPPDSHAASATPPQDAAEPPDPADGGPVATDATGVNGATDAPPPDLAVWRAEVNALSPDDLLVALDDRKLPVSGTLTEKRKRLFEAGPA